MAKLNQIIALVNGKKTRATTALSGIYHNLQKPTLFEGILKTYKPDDEEGETQPTETKLVQYKVSDAIKAAKEALTDLFDTVATQDNANTKARADVVVDGKVILPSVPVTHLLFLEKQLIDLHTFVDKLPTLDPADKWTFSETAEAYTTEPTVRNSTKKVMKNHVKAQATDKHPAQVDVYTEDQKVGEWTTVKTSGAIPLKRRNHLLARVEKLQEAVKIARETANAIDVEPVKVAAPIFEFVFAD